MTATSPTQASQIESRTLQGVHYIKLPPVVTDAMIPALIGALKEWSAMDVKMHVVDFNKLEVAPVNFYRSLQAFEVQLKMRNLNMLSINMDESISDFIRSVSLESTFNIARELVVEDPNKKIPEAKLKKLLFKYLVNAAHEAVQISLQSTVSVDENYLTKIDSIPMDQIDFISYITVNNDFLKAEFRLCSSMVVLERFAHAMLGKETKVDADLCESMGQELMNMIYGHAKSNLNENEQFRLPSAIPKSLRKKDFGRVKRSGPTKLTIMPMVTPMGAFYIEVDFG
jgi:hypothetical protein